MPDNAGMPTARFIRIAVRTLVLASLTAYAGVADATSELEEIVVSATRRPQALLDVGASISRLGPDETGLIDLLHAADALNRAPGVYVQRGSGQESLPAIRSPVLTGAGACGAFLVMEDGFPIRPVGFCNVNEMFEINSSQAAAIEVLRGPGTAVMGANAVHGAINAITPSARAVPNAAALSAGSDDFFSARLSLAPSIPEGIAAYGLWRHDGGFRDHSSTRDAKLNLLHDQRIADGELRVRVSLTHLDQQTAGFLRGFGAYLDPSTRRSNANPEAFRKADAARATFAWNQLRGTQGHDELRLTLRQSSMQFLQHFLLGKPLERNGQHSIAASAARENVLAGTSLHYRVGLDLERSDGWLIESQNGPTLEGSAVARAIRPAGKHYDYTVDARVVGLQAEVGASLGHGVDWRAALRTDRTRYAYENRMQSGNTAEDGSPCGTSGCLYSRPADRTDTFKTTTPKFEIGWRISDADRLYATTSDGFRPPEATELYRLQRAQNVADLRSERMRAKEIGWRHSGTQAHWSLAAFNATRSDVILRDANGFNVTGGKTTHRGVEYELQWAPTAAFKVGIAGTRARHRYAFSRSIEGGETIRAGDDIDTAPRALDSLELSWAPPGRWTASLTVRRVGGYFADAANEHWQNGHHVADLHVGLRTDERWQLALQVDNLADRLYADRADFAQGEWRYFPAQRRSAFLTIHWRQTP